MIMKRLLMFAIVGLLLTALATPAEAASPLYAGTSNPGVVYKYNGTTWTAISSSLGYAVLDIIQFEGNLYAATMSTSYPHSGVGKVWRYEGGMSWTLVGDNLDDQVCDLEVWNGDLYAGTAWNGGKLYCYDPDTNTFEYVGAVLPGWSGIRAMYVSSYCYLQLGDIGYDIFGRFDGTNFYYDEFHSGSCIYDFAEFNDALYGAAYTGRLLRSTNGINWSVVLGYYDGNMWELEPFQGDLYMSYDNGELASLDTSGDRSLVWTAPDGIISMVTDGDCGVLYFGIGGEAGAYYGSSTSGTGYVYEYIGTGEPTLISGAMDTGVQCLYIPPFIPVFVDIKPGSCPNPLNTKSKGVLTVAVLGTEDFDVTDIDPGTIRLTREGYEEVEPLRWSYEDVATPFGGELCECHDLNGDDYLDLTLKFDTQELAMDLSLEAEVGNTIPLILTGNLKEEECGAPIRGSDCVRVLETGKKK